MPTDLFVLRGPAHAGKTSFLIDRTLERLPSGPGRVLWLVPTPTARDAVRGQLRRRGAACVGVEILTVAEWADRLAFAGRPGAKVAPDLHLRLVLDGLLGELADADMLPAFRSAVSSRGFSDAVYALVGELLKHGITPVAWREGLSRLTGARGRYEALAVLFERYCERLESFALEDRAVVLRRATERLRAGNQGSFARVDLLVLDGFTDLTPPEHALIAAFLLLPSPPPGGEGPGERGGNPPSKDGTPRRSAVRRSNAVGPPSPPAPLPPGGERGAGGPSAVWVALSGDPEGDDGRAELFDRASATESRMYEWPHRARATKLFDAFTDPRPPGLATLAAHLFRDDAEPADDVTGLEVVEAPGVVGEVRMVARDIKRRLLAGASPESIVVAARDLETYAPLLRELFAEYGVPCRVSGPTPLAQQPWVGTLLRAVALPDDNFPFAATTALLRSGFIKPRWTQARDPATARLAEQLLRMLGETRDRTHYLRAVDAWATQPPAALEDEAGDEPRRAKIQRLAQRCGSFLHRYFACWDGLPERGTLATFGGWLAKFAQKLGLLNKDTAPEDRAAWMQLRQVFEEWAARERGWGRAGKVIPRPTFVRLLTSLATVKHHDDDPAGEAAVRCLPATDAAHLCADTVYVLGLGERGFPNLGSNETLLEEGERQQLRAGGLDLPTADGRLPGEMLLFHQLCTRALERLVLCYPAVDEKGQELLPSSFLLAVRACFAENAIPTTRQKMLIEGFDTAGPLGPAELRVRAAIEWERHADAPLLPRPLHDHLSAGRRAVASRFGERDWTAYDGRIAAPAMVRALQALVGPDKVFSPTALEDYIDCPFRFFLKHVLKLEPLADPADEVETTRRGQAFHRALTRLHQTRETCDSSAVSAALRDELARAVTEDAGRTSSLVARALWRHEGRRLDRAGGRYGDHWAEFLGGWLKANAALAPRHFELPFGMTTDVHGPLELSADGETVRIGGRIDRVDVVDLPNGGVGFYVIDYKTGSGVSYTATALNKLVKLQLPLYALAVERIVFPEGDARPLGMAYWMVTDTGAKPVLPAGKKAQQWLAALDEWPAYRDRLEAWIVRRVAAIRRGLFPLAPRERECTATCAFGHVCRISQARSRLKVWELAPGGTDDTAEP